MAATPRTASREQRRKQLIKATIKCIARSGLGSTSIGDVATEAGLSQGIVNLHFESKDNLLNETLRYIADEYKDKFNTTLEKSGPGAAEKLLALVELDLRPSIIDRQKIGVWFAFWGESKSRPTYRRICAERDRADREAIVTLCRALIRHGGYAGIDADTVAATLSAMTAGLWLDLLTRPRTIHRGQANAICTAYLAATFTRHFPRPEPGATR